jgi:uncharacterized membrane protein
MLLVGFYYYPLMPERMAIHWGLSGEPNGYGSRFLGLFLIPLISGGLLFMMLFLPGLDPFGGIYAFIDDYELFVLGFLGFTAYVNGLVLAWNLGWSFDMMAGLAPVMGVLFYGIGVLMGRTRMNWFVGIRTPWTLSSEEVWERTHEAGGRLFKLCGILAFAGLLARGWLALLLTVAPVLVSVVYLTYFSYSEYQKQIVEPSG